MVRAVTILASREIKEDMKYFVNALKNRFNADWLFTLCSLGLPALFASFFWCPTSLQRNILYALLPFITTLLIRDRQEVKAALSSSRIFWILMTAFILYMTASVAWSVTDETGRYFEKAKLSVLLMLPMVGSFYIIRRNPAIAQWSIYAFIASAVVSAMVLLSSMEYLRGAQIDRLHGMGRADNPVQGAFLYALAMLATLRVRFAVKKETLLKIISLALLSATFLLFQSRGPMIALLAALQVVVAATVTTTKISRKTLAIVIGTAAIIVLCAILWILPQIGGTDLLKRADSGRFDIWQTALQQVMEAPLFGHGMASKFSYQYTMTTGITDHIGHTHNVYLGTVVKGGFIGLTLFLVLLLYSLKQACTLAKRNGTVWPLAFIGCGATLGLVDFGDYVINLSTEWLAFWWPATITAALLPQHPPSQIHQHPDAT